MKAYLCIVLLAAAAVYGAEEKKNEKRGVLGLGYGGLAAPAPLYSHGLYGHGLGLYNHGIGGYYGHGLSAPLVSHGLYGGGYYGHGLASAPLLGHSLAYGAAPLHAPLLGLGHGWH